VVKKFWRKVTELYDKMVYMANLTVERCNQKMNQGWWNGCLLWNVWAKSAHFDILRAFFMWHYFLDCDPSCIGTSIASQIVDGHTSGHLVEHLQKEVPLFECLSQWSCLSMRLPVQQPGELSSFGVCHQNSLWVVVLCVLYSLICHGKTYGPPHRITNRSQGSHVSVWQTFSSIRKEEITYMPLNRHICLTHVHMLQIVPTPTWRQCNMPITILHTWKACPCSDKSQTLSYSRNVAWHPRR
jgi:hypothetical protein